jgi:hypothetical protein
MALGRPQRIARPCTSYRACRRRHEVSQQDFGSLPVLFLAQALSHSIEIVTIILMEAQSATAPTNTLFGLFDWR